MGKKKVCLRFELFKNFKGSAQKKSTDAANRNKIKTSRSLLMYGRRDNKKGVFGIKQKK